MRILSLTLVALIGLVVLTPTPVALAKDCGISPGTGPVIPDGTTATNDQIGVAIRAVQDYGFEVQVYTTCMNTNKDAFFLNMTELQRTRWAEDFNALADSLTEIENNLNDQIAIFNARF